MRIHALHDRVRAAQATLDAYKDKPFEWGRHDCVRMAAFNLRQLGWKVGLTRGGSYKSEVGARAALKRAGFTNLTDAIDALGLARIAPAEALPGDLISIASDSELGSVMVAVGNGRALGFHEATGRCHVLQPVSYLLAWRA